MYVCVCHAIRCRDVREAAGKGASKATEVFQHFECKPQCGRCVRTMREMLDQESSCCGEAAE